MTSLINRNGWNAQIQGYGYVSISFRPAGAWIEALSDSNAGYIVVPMARGTTRDILLDAMADSEITDDQVAAASYKLISDVTGYKWWEAVRLMLVSVRPDVLGRTVIRGMDPWSLTVGQWCAGVYALLTENMGKDDLFKFESMLGDPPEGADDDDEWDTEEFNSMVAAARAMPGQK